MDLQRNEIDGVAVVGLAEPVEIDIGNCDEFKQKFDVLLEDGDIHVVLDAANIEFFDSAGMGSLLSLQKRLKQRDGQLVLAGLNRSVTEVLHMVGFDIVFLTFPGVDEAVRSFAS